MCTQLTAFLGENDIINKRRYGFKKGKSNTLSLTHFINECVDTLEAGESVIGCFVDLTKELDCVDTLLLFNKIENCGITRSSLEDYIELTK